MPAQLNNLAVFGVFLVLCLIYQRITAYYQLKYLGHTESSEVYQAAEEFVHGAASDEIASLLTSCPELDAEDAAQILSWSAVHRSDKDGGYHEFLKSVNTVLGVSIYRPERMVS